jgi:hypothetical protein
LGPVRYRNLGDVDEDPLRVVQVVDPRLRSRECALFPVIGPR